MRTRTSVRKLPFHFAVLVLAVGSAIAEAALNQKYIRMPSPGIPVPPAIHSELQQGVRSLGTELARLKDSLKENDHLRPLIPDLEIYYNAVRYALEDDLFYTEADFAAARKVLQEGKERSAALQRGEAPWTSASGLVVRGYRSRLDNSVQPYGLVVPNSYRAEANRPIRLDLWFHGRNNKPSELSFITEREKSRGEFAPEDAIVLHPYGRYCNAFKFAGEVDVFEALENVRKNYPIDEERIAVRGFSMGGAAAWHLAVHYAARWAAAQPGAGFVDTYVFQNGAQWPVQPPWYQQKLWHLYDATDYAANLFNCPVVAYSGEIDGQRQAAELMSRAMAAEGLDLPHIIGPNTAHRFEPGAKQEVARRIDAIMKEGRRAFPAKIRFTTWTLRYNQMAWVTVDALDRHWERARVEAEIKDNKIEGRLPMWRRLLFPSQPTHLC